jgi:hypothetical protein
MAKKPPTVVPFNRDVHTDENYPVQVSFLGDVDTVILISSLFMVEPKVLDDLIRPQVLSEEDCEFLTTAINREISIEARDALGEAIRKLLMRIAVSVNIVPVKDYEKQLKKTRKGAVLILDSMQDSVEYTKKRGILSVGETIEKFAETRGFKVSELKYLVTQCDEQLKLLNLQSSKRGVKADDSIQNFFKSIVYIANVIGMDLIVGMHKEKQNTEDEVPFNPPDTPLFIFARTMLNYARDRASFAFSQSHGLTHEDCKVALKRFDALRPTDGRSLQTQLRVAIAALRATETVRG